MAELVSENYKSNFSTTVKLDDVRIDMRANGPHSTIVPNHHAHTGYEVQAALMGEYHIKFGDKKVLMQAPGTVCLIPPGCYHSSHYVGPKVRQIGLGMRFDWRHKPGQGETSGLLEALERLPKNEPVLLTGAGVLCGVPKELRHDAKPVPPRLLRQSGREAGTLTKRTRGSPAGK